MLQAIKYSKTTGLQILNQLRLPLNSEYVQIANVDDGFASIKSMQVRGAPAIAIVGMLSVNEEIKNMELKDKAALFEYIRARLEYLVTSRPTAVNLSKASSQIIKLCEELLSDETKTVFDMKESIMRFSEGMLEKDIQDNKAIGQNGAKVITKQYDKACVNVLTICNTGSLATAGYGTALGVVRALHEVSGLNHCYCLETRPYNQGARLTAFELVHDKIPSTLICDSMATLLMERKTVHAVLVGADRVAANGDTANKIGTHQLAIVSKHFGVPFYVCAPFTSIDRNIKCGADIVIEERPQEELACINSIRVAAPGINCWNPAFDVTPASLIAGIVTERGVYNPSELHHQL